MSSFFPLTYTNIPESKKEANISFNLVPDLLQTQQTFNINSEISLKCSTQSVKGCSNLIEKEFLKSFE